MNERTIVSLTSYEPRFQNLPTVLDTILAQTVKPDLIVLNLAHEAIVPNNVQEYLDKHKVEVFRVDDTRVYKKLLPTLKRYPNDIVISIDDDWLYPEEMIADFLKRHSQYPNHPISGNKLVFSEMICHCGCASLAKAEFFGDYLDTIDQKIIQNCSCDDIVYTYFANKAGHPYITTEKEYFTNLTPYNEGHGYSEKFEEEHRVEKSFSFLVQEYGVLPHFTNTYITNPYIAEILYHIHNLDKKDSINKAQIQIRNSARYKLGKLLLKPLSFLHLGK